MPATAVDEDPVVRELDVYVCTQFVGSATQLCLFQHPLRPPWRPYEYEKVPKLRMKPQSKRVEVEIPLEVDSNNYNDMADEHKLVKHITLQSSLAEAKTSYAVGSIKDGKLLLAPLDTCLQMRPLLTFLDDAKAKGDDDDDDEEEEDAPKMTAIEVQVKKRETERQQQARLNSYEYLHQKERDEQWVNLNVHIAESKAAESVWERFMTAGDKQQPPTLDRPTYLKSVIPTGQVVPADAGVDLSSLTLPPSNPTAASSSADALSPESQAALPIALSALFATHSVCSMANVRQWLQDTTEAPAARDAAFLTDRSLHEAIVASGDYVCIRRMYIQSKLNNPQMDPLRSIVLELIKDKENFKRAEVVEVATSKKLTVTDTLYNKVVKDLCMSRGNYWSLKNGADM